MEPTNAQKSHSFIKTSPRTILIVTLIAVIAIVSFGIRRDVALSAPLVSNRSGIRLSHSTSTAHAEPVSSLETSVSPHYNDEALYAEAEKAFGDVPMVLHQVPLFNCLDNNYKTHKDVPWRDMSDEAAFRGRWLCYCLEQRPRDYHNCFSRFINATIYRSYQSEATRERTVVLLDSVGFEGIALQVDSSREPWTAHKVLLYSTRECEPNETRVAASTWVGNLSLPTCGAIQPNMSTTAPYTEPFSFSTHPLLLAPVLTVQQNHYHSLAGPSGVLQYIMSRVAINKFYFDRERMRRDKTGSEGDSSEWYPPIIDGSDTSLNTKYIFNPTNPRVDISNRGSCSIMNFSSLDDRDYGWRTNNSVSRLPPMSTLGRHRLPPTFLSREMLVGYDMAERVPKTLGTIGWFGRREGFCNLDLPHESYSVVRDLWVNLIGKHLTTQWLLRRGQQGDEVSKADIVLAEEFLKYCPALPEETAAARWSADQMIRTWDAFKPSLATPSYELQQDASTNMRPIYNEGIQLAEGRSPIRECMKVNRPPGPDGKISTLCALAIGRGLHFDMHRQRGLPPHVEKMIVTALVMPLPSAQTGSSLILTPKEEMVTSRWWGWDNETRSRRCEKIVPGASQNCPNEIETLKAAADNRTAKGLLEQLNLDAGLLPCATPSLSPPFWYDCVRFPTTSPYYNASNLLRTNFDSIPVIEQFAQIRAANLFIFEEGAPLSWAMAAQSGSTFICIYNSNFMRYEGDKGRWRTVRKEVKVGDRLEIIEELEPARYNGGSYSPQSEFFVTMPHLLGKVRLILVVYQYSRWPSMAKLREVFDMPFEAETYVVTCECDQTRVVPYPAVKQDCSSYGKNHDMHTPNQK